MTLAERLALAMKEKKFTQLSLSKEINLSQSMICKLLNGQTETTSRIVDLANALGVRPEWLNHGIEPMHYFHHESNLTPVELYNRSYKTGHLLMIPDLTDSNYRAYKIIIDSGCAEVKRGTFIVVDTNEKPKNKDLVYAKINGDYSVYRFISVSGVADKYLSVDDSRIPLIPMENSHLVGVIVYLLYGIRQSHT